MKLLNKRQILMLHQHLVDDTGGSPGPQDEGLLHFCCYPYITGLLLYSAAGLLFTWPVYGRFAYRCNFLRAMMREKQINSHLNAILAYLHFSVLYHQALAKMPAMPGLYYPDARLPSSWDH